MEPTTAPMQLCMTRADLDGLPPLRVPEGYELRLANDDEAPGLAALVGLAFQDAWDEERANAELLQHPRAEGTFVATFQGAFVATATALSMEGDNATCGYLHYVAADPAHAGHGLGLLVSAAVLHRLAGLGKTCALLHTDDQRLPALRTYLKLGFQPKIVDPSQPERWRVIYEKLGAAQA